MTRIHSRMSASVSSVKVPATPGQRPRLAAKASSPVVREHVELGSEKLSGRAVNEVVLGGVRSSVRDALGKANGRPAPEPGASLPADASHEATARHIFEFATGYYGDFRASRPELSESEARSQFSSIVGEAVNSGVDGAIAVLKGLSALMNAELFTKVEKTRSLVNNMISTFLSGGPQ